MFQEVFCLSFFIFSFVLSLLSVCTAYSNVYVKCSQVNFTSMTPYESNVNSLFTSLVDSASIYNFNKFETSPQSDGVYGLFQCRGDLSSPNCKECVASSVGQLKTTCSLSIGGEIQLEECFVKYDDTSFFGAQDKMEVCRKCGPSIGYNSDVLNRIDGALAYLVGGNGQYFRGGDFGSIQGVAQCVQDLSLSDCQDCLAEASGRLRSECETSTWGDMYLGKCYIRYADQGNGLVNNGNSTSNNSNGGESNNDIMKWIGYIIAAVVTALSAGVGVTFAFKNTNKNKNANENNNANENRNDNIIRNYNIFQNDVKRANENADNAKDSAVKAMDAADKAEKKAKEAKKKAKEVEKKAKEAEEKSVPQYPNYPGQMPPTYNYYYSDPNPNACSVM